MKNIEAGANAVFAQGKEEEVKVEVEEVEEEYTQHQNEMYFFLRGRPEYRISAVGRWLENQKGEVIGDADTYFCHIMTGERCESAWGCLIGWSDDERIEEIWETLAMRIQNTDGLEQIICDEETFEV